jgi:hypothetical protein
LYFTVELRRVSGQRRQFSSLSVSPPKRSLRWKALFQAMKLIRELWESFLHGFNAPERPPAESSWWDKFWDILGKILDYGAYLAVFFFLVWVIRVGGNFIWQKYMTRPVDPVVAESVIDGAICRALAKGFDGALNEDRQKIFDEIHPIGEAIRVDVENVRITKWRNGHPEADETSIQQVDVTCTLYWKSPLISHGRTKFVVTLDWDHKERSTVRVTETNGITTDEARSGALRILVGKFLK